MKYVFLCKSSRETSVRFNIIKRKIREICGICVRLWCEAAVEHL